jgi:hypothetical protein
MSRHNVFISHRHEDDSLIEDLKTMLREADCDVRDSSINASTPNRARDEDYIKSLLQERMQWAGKILVIVSPQTKDHEWVDWEIEYANTHPDKRIVGVWAPDADGCDLPEALELYADAVVTWDAAEVIAALDGADNWEQPDGTPAPPRQITRAPC